MSTPSPSTAAPTFAPQTPAQVNAMIWAVIIVITACLVGMWLCLMVCSHAKAAARKRKIDLDILHREMEKVGTAIAAESDKEKIQKLTARSQAIYKMAARLTAQRGISYELDDAFVVAAGSSKEASAMYDMAFHTSMGRTAAVAFLQLTTQINSTLGFLLSFFVHSFVQDEIVRSGADERRAQLQSISITFFVMFIFNVLATHFGRYINSGMGNNPDIFYYKPKEEEEHEILDSLPGT